MFVKRKSTMKMNRPIKDFMKPSQININTKMRVSLLLENRAQVANLAEYQKLLRTNRSVSHPSSKSQKLMVERNLLPNKKMYNLNVSQYKMKYK